MKQRQFYAFNSKRRVLLKWFSFKEVSQERQLKHTYARRLYKKKVCNAWYGTLD